MDEQSGRSETIRLSLGCQNLPLSMNLEVWLYLDFHSICFLCILKILVLCLIRCTLYFQQFPWIWKLVLNSFPFVSRIWEGHVQAKEREASNRARSVSLVCRRYVSPTAFPKTWIRKVVWPNLKQEPKKTVLTFCFNTKWPRWWDCSWSSLCSLNFCWKAQWSCTFVASNCWNPFLLIPFCHPPDFVT